MAQRFLAARLLALVLVLCLGAGTAVAADKVEQMNLGDMQSLIESSKGRPVFLNFFATWCPPCRAEIPSLVEMNKNNGDRVVFVGLTVDDSRTIGKVPDFIKKMKMNYPVYQAKEDVVRKFSIRSIPFNVGYDKKGKMVFAYSGVMDEMAFEKMLQELLQ